MSKQQSTKPGKGWFKKSVMAEILDVSGTHFDRSYRRFAGTDAEKSIDGILWFHARRILDAWARHMRDTATGEPVDPLLLGSDSPGLERYRLAKARLAELELKKTESSLIPRDELAGAVLRVSGILRRAGETLQRQFGNEAADILTDALNDVDAGWQIMLAQQIAEAAA